MSLKATVATGRADAVALPSERIYFWEPTGDTIYVSKTMNITARTDDAVHLEHDPDVDEELQFCEVYGKAQAQLCGQGYCRGTSISSTSSHMC